MRHSFLEVTLTRFRKREEKEEKRSLCMETGLTMNQVSNWFINACVFLLRAGSYSMRAESKRHVVAVVAFCLRWVPFPFKAIESMLRSSSAPTLLEIAYHRCLSAPAAPLPESEPTLMADTLQGTLLYHQQRLLCPSRSRSPASNQLTN